MDRADLEPLLALLRPRRTRLVLAWLVAIGSALVGCSLAWNNCRDPQRPDGDWGHVNIDFSGQWLLAALFARGEARHLYDRPTQAEVLRHAYPQADEAPGQERHDADKILDWL